MRRIRVLSALLTGLSLPAGIMAQDGKETPLTTREPHYYIDHARPADKINAIYPHDISLRTVQGDTVVSSEVLPQGKPVMLLFWLTTCYPCRMELDALRKVYGSWQDSLDFELIAISTDFPKNYAAVEQRVGEQQWPWPVFVDLHREFSRILPGGLNGLPQTFFLNAQGEITGHKRKFRPGDEAELFALLRQAAGKP